MSTGSCLNGRNCSARKPSADDGADGLRRITRWHCLVVKGLLALDDRFRRPTLIYAAAVVATPRGGYRSATRLFALGKRLVFLDDGFAD